MEQKHLSFGVGLLAVLVAASALVAYGVTSAQSACSYFLKKSDGTNLYDGVALYATAGQPANMAVKIQSASPGCGTDTITAEVVDSNWNLVTYCTLGGPVTIQSPAGSAGSADVTITCTFPQTSQPNPSLTLRTVRDVAGTRTTTNSSGFSVQVSGVGASCTTITLSSSKQSYASGESVNLDFTLTPAACTAQTLVLQISPPGGAGFSNVETRQNITATSGVFTVSSSQMPIAGTYGFQACVGACETGVKSPVVSIQYSTTTTGGITYPAAQANFVTGGMSCRRGDNTTYSPNASGYCEPGHSAVCPFDGIPKSATFNSQIFPYCERTTTAPTTCPSGQTWCPASGSSPAGCYVACPTTITPGACKVGETCPLTS